MLSSSSSYRQPFPIHQSVSTVAWPKHPNQQYQQQANPFQLQSTGFPTPAQPFSAQTQTTLSAPSPSTAAPQEKATTAKKPKVQPIGYLFPALTMVGTPLMLGASLLGVQNKGTALKFIPSDLAKKVEKKFHVSLQGTAKSAVLKNAFKAGKLALALGIIPKTIIGMQYGLKAQQPSIILSHLMQLPLAPMIWKDSPVATTLASLMGGLFTLGFINDVDNGYLKKGIKDSSQASHRSYDMTNFKNVFSKDSPLSLGQRLWGLISEPVKMSGFVVEDHWRTTKRAFSELGKLFTGKKSDLVDTNSAASISKSSVGVLLCYLANIPPLITSIVNKGKPTKSASILAKYSMGTTLLSGFLLNFGMILVALTGKNWAERIPLVGSTLELSGTVAGYSPSSKIRPFAVALQQFGAGLNTLFYANKAQE